MKSLTESINEARKPVKKALTGNNTYMETICESFDTTYNYGFITIAPNAEIVNYISFDNLEDYANLDGGDINDYKGIDKLNIGESVFNKKAGLIYTRIW